MKGLMQGCRKPVLKGGGEELERVVAARRDGASSASPADGGREGVSFP